MIHVFHNIMHVHMITLKYIKHDLHLLSTANNSGTQTLCLTCKLVFAQRSGQELNKSLLSLVLCSEN